MNQGVDSGPVAREEVRSTLDEVLRASEFDQSPTMMEKFIAWLKEIFDFGGIGGATANLFWLGLKVLAVVAGLLVIWLLIRTLRTWAREQSAGPEVSDRASLTRNRVAELRASASAAELAGDHLLALRLYFFALVVGLGERGELAYNDAWTNRELLERGTPTAEVAGTLNPLLGELDLMSFGERAVESSDVRRFESLCDRWLGRGDQ